jgi:plasmid stability protein
MATLTIRNLPDDVRDRLRVRAAENGRSMEAEARATLADTYGSGDRGSRPDARERIERARRLVAPYLKPGVSLVEELMAERRKAAERGD